MTPQLGFMMWVAAAVLVATSCSAGVDSPTNSSPGGRSGPASSASGSTSDPNAQPTNTGSAAPRTGEPGFETLPECLGRRATILGSPGADQIIGTRRMDVVVTRAGDDEVRGLREDDRVCTGAGDDTVADVDGAWGADLGTGEDRMYDAGLFLVRAGPGKDRVTLAVNSPADLEGGAGDDVLRVALDGRRHPAFNTPCVTYGHDATGPMRINLARGFAVGRGHDRLINVHCIRSGPFDDQIVGSAGADSIDVGGGDNEVWALAGNDGVHTYAYNGADVFYLGPGNDEGHPAGLADRVYGGPGNDWIEGFDGADFIAGGPGNDRIHGGGMCDFGSSSGSGTIDSLPNELFGGPGDDYLTGDLGNDRLDGGPGHDRGQGGFHDGRADWIVSLERFVNC